MFIDVHGHLSPPGDTGGPPDLRDPEAAIARKRELGIVLTVIGSPVGAGSMRPAPGVDNYAQSADTVRAHNEVMIGLVDRYPDALRTYAYLDPLGGPAMLEQARDLVADPRCVGLVVNTSVNGRYLDGPDAEPFFAMAAELGVPVLLHPPAVPVGAAALGDPGLVEHVGRFGDVTAGVAAIAYAGWPARYPGLRLVAAAGGGGLALLGAKLDLAAAAGPPGRPERPGPPPSASLARIHVDTSTPGRAALAASVAAFGADHVLFGTDAPPLMAAAEPAVRAVAALPDPDREAVAWRNAAALYGIDPAPAAAAASRKEART
jgi:aminocarboxymuconate-semialdehyde decarboxylase